MGAGAAGIALSVQLANQGMVVALLEAGGAGFESKSQEMYFGATKGMAFHGLYNGRCRMLGGTTTIWGGQITEIDDHVFRDRPWVSGGKWPLSKEDLRKYYDHAVQMEGLAGSSSDAAEIWRSVSDSPPVLGADLNVDFSRWCPVRDFAQMHRKALRTNGNLHLFLHANVRQLEFAGDDQTVLSAHVRTLGRPDSVFRARRFALTVGGIETSRLLLQPDFGGRVNPWMQSYALGKHFQDHPVCSVARIDSPRTDLARHFDYLAARGFKYQAKIKLRPELQRHLQTLDVCGTIALTKDGEDDLALAYETYRLWRTRQLRSITAGRIGHFLLTAPKLVWHRFPKVSSIRGFSRNGSLRLVVHCEQDPCTTGAISLQTERDAIGLLRARVSWQTSPLELHTVRAFTRTAAQSFQDSGLGTIVADPALAADDVTLASSFRESYHHLGGARMATDKSSGVVDPNLLVFGTRNLFVCSSAVFPSAGCLNPTHTVIALCLRLAAHLSNLRAAV
jgi:choline dehydrogenase-like flavoprotein